LARTDLERIRAIAEGALRMLELCTAEAVPADVRAALKDAPVGDSKAKLLRAHAALQLARIEEARERRLLNDNVGVQRGYDQAAAELAAAEAEFVAQREEIAFEADRSRLAAERAVAVAQAALDSAGRALQILGLSEAEIASLGEQDGERLSRYELRSPVAGRVVERQVSPGESATESDALFLLADTSRMWLLADVYESDLALLREGTRLLFTVDGMPGASFEGRLSWISSRVDDRTRTVRVRADLPNREGLLRARMFGQARLLVGEPGEVVSVPAGAVQTDGCCQLVFVQTAEALFTPRKVALGASANGFVEILRGLAEGERVAGTGSFLLKTEILKSNIGAGCCEVDPGR
jgi:RND family efflux transporter MFP subunit